jgi:ribosomal protein L29
MNTLINELRKKDMAELSKLLKEARVSSLTESLQYKIGKSKVTGKRKSKKEIAQILTVLKEKEILNG